MPDAMALTTVLVLPAAAAALVPFVRTPPRARAFAMAAMLAVLAVAISVFVAFDGQAAGRYAIHVAWMPSLGIDLSFAVDGFNVYLLLLTALLFPVVLACAWNTVEGRSRYYLCLMLALEAGLVGTFLAQNLMVLFVLWEAVLIPMVLLMLAFGGPERRRAAMTFFLYTMAGSVLFLAAVLLLGVESLQQTGRWSFELDVLSRLQLSPARQAFVFAAIALACAVKCPLFPFHSWLPLAYGEASISGTALMAGVMSKMGAFGFLRLAVPLAPDAAQAFGPAVAALAVVSILYGAVLALRERHFGRLVAYASLSHMGYIVLGVFSFVATGVHGSLFQILSHGLAVAGLFLLLGLLEQRRGAAYADLEGLATRMPRFAVVLMLFVLASLGLPLSSGFTAEFLVLLGAFTHGLAAWQESGTVWMLVVAIAACAGVVLGATYMLRFARALVFGDAGRGRAPIADLGPRETLALVPVLLLILWIGVAPASLMVKVEPAVAQIVAYGTGGGAAGAGSVRVVDAQGGSRGR